MSKLGRPRKYATEEERKLAHREQTRKSQRNSLKMKLSVQQYHKANKIKCREQARQWRENNKAKFKKNTEQWMKNNTERNRITSSIKYNSIPAGVYMIKCLANGKCYIGQSKRPYVRRASHFSTFTTSSNISNPLIKADMDKYGKSAFVFGVIEHCEADKLLEREAYYISKLNPAYNTLKKDLVK
jgi:hypothetical protein